MLNEFILDATWADWVLMSSFALIGITIVDRYGYFKWLESICTKKLKEKINYE